MTGRILHRDQRHQKQSAQDGADASLWQATTLEVSQTNQRLFDNNH